MEVAHIVARSLSVNINFITDPVLLIPICGHPADDGSEHRSQLILKWIVKADGEAPELQVCVVLSVWASVWARRKSKGPKVHSTSSEKQQKFVKKPARHLVGFPVPALCVSRVRVAPLTVDVTEGGKGLTYMATPDSPMRVGEHSWH